MLQGTIATPRSESRYGGRPTSRMIDAMQSISKKGHYSFTDWPQAADMTPGLAYPAHVVG